jgi:hypothetical protein
MRRRFVMALTVCVLAGGLAPGAARAGAAADEQELRQAGIATDGPGLLAFFRNRTVDGTDQERIRATIRRLGDDSFTAREQASRQLVALGPRARQALREAVKDPDVEIARRAQECLRQIEEGASAGVVAAAARLLAHRRPDGAAEALLNYLPSAEEEEVAAEVRAALGDLAVRDGKAEPALVRGLGDPHPVKRAAAGEALARARAAEELPAVRKLLADPDGRVRLRVGLALAETREKEAVPALIRLIDQLPGEDTGPVEELLCRLAGERAPAPPPGADAAARRRYREAWEGWWKEHQMAVDAARLGEVARTLGYTLVVLLDRNLVMELDGGNRPLWQIAADFPLDAQLVDGGGHVLIAEHNANRVTERDHKGEVKWEFKVEAPLAAQRLANGHTFVATRDRLLEVDKDGKEVFSHTRPGGENIMKAAKLPNGDIVCITQLGVTRCLRLKPDGKDFKEAKSFGVDVRYSGGRIDVLPNGNVLVAETTNNRILEHDATGRVVREFDVEQPIAAVRLANGHTLVTSMSQHRAVELDRAGKEVWQFKSSTRVTRAFRR